MSAIKILPVIYSKRIKTELQQTTFHQINFVLRWILRQSQVLGLATLGVEKRGFQISKPQCIINLIRSVIFLPLAIYGIYLVTLSESSVIEKSTDIIELVVNTTYLLTIWIWSMINGRDFISFLLKLIDFDVKSLKIGVTIDYDDNRKKILIQQIGRYIMLTISIALLTVFALKEIFNHEMFSESIAFFTLIMNSAVCHLTGELIWMIKTRFVILNKELLKIIQFFKTHEISIVDMKINDENKNYEQLMALCRVCSLHHHLTKMIKLFNEIFGVILLLMFGVSFVSIVVSLFYCTGGLQANQIDWIRALTPLCSSWTFVFDTVYICHACYATIEEVNQSGELIHKIDTEDHDIRDEIEMFSLQIANEQVEFSAAGFFPINFALLFSIIGGVTTYIIILIQLSATLVKK